MYVCAKHLYKALFVITKDWKQSIGDGQVNCGTSIGWEYYAAIKKNSKSSNTFQDILSSERKRNCKGQKPVYFVFRGHICALTYKWADTPWKDTYSMRNSSYYGAVSVARASGWEGASLSLQTPWYSLVLCRWITDYIDYLSIKYPEREGWQTQRRPPEAHSLGEEKSQWTQTLHQLASSWWGPHPTHMPL